MSQQVYLVMERMPWEGDELIKVVSTLEGVINAIELHRGITRHAREFRIIVADVDGDFHTAQELDAPSIPLYGKAPGLRIVEPAGERELIEWDEVR